MQKITKAAALFDIPNNWDKLKNEVVKSIPLESEIENFEIFYIILKLEV